MKRVNVLHILAYLLVSVVSVGGAFMLSLHFLGVSSAQAPEPPPPPPPPLPDDESAVPAEDDGAETTENEREAMAQVAAASSGIAELEGFLEPFIYDIVNRRDPFQAYAEYVPVQDMGPARALTPAQKYDLEQLRLVGVMWDIKDPKAMFMDPDKEVLVLSRDESIGNRNGYIAAIREGEVVVVEALRKRGDIIYRTRVLRIER